MIQGFYLPYNTGSPDRSNQHACIDRDELFCLSPPSWLCRPPSLCPPPAPPLSLPPRPPVWLPIPNPPRPVAPETSAARSARGVAAAPGASNLHEHMSVVYTHIRAHSHSHIHTPKTWAHTLLPHIPTPIGTHHDCFHDPFIIIRHDLPLLPCLLLCLSFRQCSYATA